NAYKLTSLFDTENVLISADNGDMISVHLAMKKSDFLLISNIDYNMIIKEITQQEYTETIDPLVTMFVLNGIMAFDESKNADLYDMLVKVSHWQIEKCGNDINYLNNYQLLKRNRKLTIEEISKLNTIKMENQDLHIKLGASILLESNTEIDAYWRKLDDEQKELFRKYPICHLAEDLLQD
ncbi:MAG: exportin/importin beta family protein, partial [Acetivibrio ethanolgignens]